MQKEINILVVDNEPIMRDLFTDILSNEGYKVTAFCNGREAIDRIKERSFDVAFIDRHMPGIDGIQTLRVIKEISPEIKVVMTDSDPDKMYTEAIRESAITIIH